MAGREFSLEVMDMFQERIPVAGRINKLPKNLFGTIVGYSDVKALFQRSIKAPKQTHILLAGPPASAKTVFLLECERLKGAYFILGYKTTKAGLVQLLLEEEPSYLLIDEIEKMDKEAMNVLLGLMDPGIVKDVKWGDTQVKYLKTNVYAACNYFDQLKPEVLSRFHFKLQFKGYTYEEFIEVGTRVLTMLEGTKRHLAEYISRKIAKYTRNIRTAIGIARLATTEDDVDFLINIQLKYRPYSRNFINL
jgi:Holliday junction DNA helicase RuvB